MSTDRRNVKSIIVSGSVWLALSGFLAYVGYFAMYFYFDNSDDEGYWLISLRSYHLHGSLYHNTYGQAGPFYYEAWSLLYSVSGLPIDWDTGRAITLIMWIATSLLFGIAMWILSGSMLLGLLGELVSFLVLFALASVSMEPAGLAHLLGAFVLLGIAIYVRGRRRVGFGVVGAAGGALVLTKVNIGVFVMACVIATVAIYWPSQRWVSTRKLFVALGILMLPVLLMAQALNKSWAWHFCVLELFYLVGLVAIIVTKEAAGRAFARRELVVGLMAALGSAMLIAMGVLINGTSFALLIHGAIFSQRDLARIAHIPLPITGVEVVVAALSSFLAVLIAAYTAKQGHRPNWLNSVSSGYLRLAVGIWILLTICGIPGSTPHGLELVSTATIPVPGQTFLLAAPFAWVAALGGDGSEDGAYSFARVAICLIGVVGCLEAFPVAGAQRWWAALTMVPVGIVCITDALSIISPLNRGRRWLVGGVLEVPLASLVVTALALFLCLGNVDQVLAWYRAGYYAHEPLKLTGADRVTLPPSQVSDLRGVTAFLKKDCSTFWSLPGLNSFYLFSGETPPTGLNASQMWWNQFDLNQQNRILVRLRHTSGLCVVEYGFPNGTSSVVQTPLVRYIERDFVAAKTVGPYRLFVRSTLSTA